MTSSVPCAAHEHYFRLVDMKLRCFALIDSEISHTSTVQMEIDTCDHLPISRKPYCTPLESREVIEKAIENMLHNGIISLMILD